MYPVEAFSREFQETIVEIDQINLLNAVGNHEAKLVTLAIIASRPNEEFTGSKLHQELAGRQAGIPTWVPSRQLAFAYCKDSLEPLGTVVEGWVKGRNGPSPTYSVSEFGHKWGLPLAGTLLEWSLEYSELSLMQIFGATNSATSTRSPEVKYKIFQELLTSNAAPSMVDLARTDLLKDTNAVTLISNIRGLASSGLIDVQTVLDYSNNPTFQITEASPRPRGNSYESRNAETQAIYDVIDILKSQGVSEIDIDTLAHGVIKENPNLEVYSVRKRLAQALANRFIGLQPVGRPLPEYQRSTVTMNPEHLKAITDLINRIASVFSGEELDKYSRTAIAIINDPKHFGELMLKINRFSPHVIGSNEGGEILNQRILSILNTLGRVTLKDLGLKLREQGRPLKADAIRNNLKAMVENGTVILEKSPVAETRGRKVSTYSLSHN